MARRHTRLSSISLNSKSTFGLSKGLFLIIHLYTLSYRHLLFDACSSPALVIFILLLQYLQNINLNASLSDRLTSCSDKDVDTAFEHRRAVKRALPSVIRRTGTKHYRLRSKEGRYDPGSNLLVGQRSAEMLLDVGFQHRVEVLELSVSDQAYDVYLADSKGKNRDDHVLASAGQVDAKKSRCLTLHPPMHQTRGCHNHPSGSVPS